VRHRVGGQQRTGDINIGVGYVKQANLTGDGNRCTRTQHQVVTFFGETKIGEVITLACGHFNIDGFIGQHIACTVRGLSHEISWGEVQGVARNFGSTEQAKHAVVE